MATYNILTAHTGAGTQQTMAGGDSLFLAHSGTLNSLGANGASSSGGDNDLQIHGTLAGGNSAFLGADGGDLIQIYSDATVLGGVVSAITVDGTGGNAFMNAGAISTHTTQTGTTVIDLEGSNNSVTNTGSITANQFGTGVLLGGGTNTFNNSGSITAGTDGHNFASGDAVHINAGGSFEESGTQMIVNSGSISALNGQGLFVGGDGDNSLSNTSSGVISGSTNGVYLSGDDNEVTNQGSITGGSGDGLYIGDDGGNFVFNSGTISGGATGVNIDGSGDTLINGTRGHISGGSATGDGHNGVTVDGSGVFINNHGSIVGGSTGIHIDGSENTLDNSSAGHITGQGNFDTGVYMSGGDNTVNNHGHITGGLDGNGLSLGFFGEGTGDNHVFNSHGGVISDSVGDNETTGAAAVEMLGFDNTLLNSGTISMDLGSDFEESDNAAVYVSGGDNSITNGHSGVITDGNANDLDNAAIYFGEGSNTVSNHGHITGTVDLGDGGDGDSFNGATGHFNGTIYGSDENDSIEVGKGHSTVFGGDGADFLSAGSGSHAFDYTGVDNSMGDGSDNFDTVDHFSGANDSFNFALHDGASFDSADFHSISGAALTESNFDADLKADIGGQLHADSAVLLHISGGEFANDTFLVVDGNGQAGYQAGSDYVIELTNINGTITAADIHGTSFI